ncbi:rod shape-determining protein MreC [Arenibacter latericius]|uniref:rod shape-determining protein MreC n=1 Tax=Arenibacter latericius TaxID=86104 RepID=UPI0004055EBD|nr:rod shape-determining protein MreC [Arenibacter latericius]MDX1363881.1 rod shape-determining protein MreC [Arenibacter latericius]
MQQIINFILKYKNFLLYVLLMIIALTFTIRAQSYHNSKFFNSANWLTGNLYESTNNVSTFFSLGIENKKLVEENKRLRYQLFNQKKEVVEVEQLDSTQIDYEVFSGQIIKNSYSLPRNYITLNKGSSDGLEIDMGVITADGILGIIEHTSKNFSLVQSILNVRSRINAKIKNTNHYGSLTWDTKDYRTAQLKDIERLVPLNIGDTIVTGASSSIFPENIPIGVIENFEITTSQSSYHIDVRLFNDMTTVKNVYIIKNTNRKEIIELESKIRND